MVSLKYLKRTHPKGDEDDGKENGQERERTRQIAIRFNVLQYGQWNEHTHMLAPNYYAIKLQNLK